MSASKEKALERLKGALSASLDLVREDPEFLVKVSGTICRELGVDQLASMYIANKIKNAIKKKEE